jgi:chorismate mutase/prephenate dehydratase
MESDRHRLGNVSAGLQRSGGESPAVAYLGPEGTYTHQAAFRLYGQPAASRFLPGEGLEEVFDLVESGRCGKGVVPIENSIEGSVRQTLDLLHRFHLIIQAEVFLRIRHQLLSKATGLGEIQRLYSHPMALAQCRSWIKQNLPGVSLSETGSTALAAKAAFLDPTSGAIGSEQCSRLYGLETLASDIGDYPDNVTRFLGLGKTAASPGPRNKTSILFLLKHEPGSLFRMLEPIAQRAINMTRIESLPLRARHWEYLFYLDMEGHETDPDVAETLKEMSDRSLRLKRLGSYPMGDEP